MPLAIWSSSALHFLILERGERVEAGGDDEKFAAAGAPLDAVIEGGAATPAGLQLARGVAAEEPERAVAGGGEVDRRRSRCFPAEAAVADA